MNLLLKAVVLFTVLFPTCKADNLVQLYSSSLEANRDPEYYIDQAQKYFDTLDTYASRKSKPIYAKRVLRWEWYPWLKLTGFKKFFMKIDRVLTWYPTAVIDRDCRFFEKQPFARCRVVFDYKSQDELVPIYEEFTFNREGEISFVEAWTDKEGFLPMNPSIDPWAETENVNRLSTRVPGLGLETGVLKTNDKIFKQLAKNDSDLADLRRRMKHPGFYWVKEGLRYLKTGH